MYIKWARARTLMAYDDTDAGGLEGLPGLAITSRTTCPSCPFVLHSYTARGSCKVARMAKQDPSETHGLFEVHFTSLQVWANGNHLRNVCQVVKKTCIAVLHQSPVFQQCHHLATGQAAWRTSTEMSSLRAGRITLTCTSIHLNSRTL